MTHGPSSRLEIAGRTDVGRKRSHNEDCYRIEPGLGLFLVADGMGGHALGEVASRLAADAVAGHLLARSAGPRRPEDLREAVVAANRRIYDENLARGFAEGAGMGTTLVGARVLDPPDRLGIAHVGDSRLYCWRDGALTRLTRDHTLYQEWLDGGAQGRAPRRNVILRALGPWPELDVDTLLHPLHAGDVYLACSDGLSGLVDEPAMAAVLAGTERGGDLDAACQGLVDLALEAGGDDNVTVVLARCHA